MTVFEIINHKGNPILRTKDNFYTLMTIPFFLIVSCTLMVELFLLRSIEPIMMTIISSRLKPFSFIWIIPASIKS